LINYLISHLLALLRLSLVSTQHLQVVAASDQTKYARQTTCSNFAHAATDDIRHAA